MANKNRIITVQNIPITISMADEEDYICITDMAAAKAINSRPADIVRNWLRNRSTLEFLSTWEELYNTNFKVFESEHFKKDVGLVTFTPSVSEWVDKTGAIGLFVKKGRYGGTFAHKDIAFEFASAISPVFKLYLIKEFQRLKTQENNLKKIEWNAKRFLSKNNYLIQTDAVKNYIVPNCNYQENLQWLPYAEEADVLNVALFGFTAKAWRDANPELAKNSNVRDYATINELTVLSNLETHNAQMIREGKEKAERFEILREIAEYQMRILDVAENINKQTSSKMLEN
ncbi:MAG: KilA-N domain-containing protein [Lachnospiraceae bacterium]|nr:KilA-N domain-containing protein [Lachnospiraceae bacterium]